MALPRAAVTHGVLVCFGAAASAVRAVGVSLSLHALISDPWVGLML